ncbi:flagellar biosynthesis regulator FlaF [uncultured Nisaea sp.]|jgi:flagellar biosynthesis activator protein FlaF|uniref:flagellar biosynthesis regulator FlaF n=1 Tax=uncultured Nisaea sp. TaxID=538215 RepID=UPI0030EE1FAB|tara:strand:- start:830 stop:1267 length:438 start_codon:yes stop_codon:yes gene_type:complete
MSGIDAYKKTINQTATSRDTEYRLLAQVTSELMKAIDNKKGAANDPSKMAQVASALNWNKQVWDVFVEDCGTAGNQLPRDLRAAIVSLGIWVTKETAIALEGEGDLDSLVAVNRDIMKGLKPSQAPDSQPAPRPGGSVSSILDQA